MKNFIKIDRKAISLQDVMNELQTKKLTKEKYRKELNKIEQELCLTYNATFFIKIEETEGKFFSTMYLNDHPLLTFTANF